MARIGIIVDGVAEYESLPRIIRRIATPNEIILPVVRADLQPRGPLPQVLRTVKKSVQNVFVPRRADRILVLLDHDHRTSCARNWAIQFQASLDNAFPGIPVHCVIKNGCYENWLIADFESVEKLKDFKFSKADKASIKGAADNVDALKLIESALRAAAPKRTVDYAKRAHASRIMSVADPIKIAANSRSFRRLLRLVDNPVYLLQSRVP